LPDEVPAATVYRLARHRGPRVRAMGQKDYSMSEVPQYTRRLSDKILMAFNQACEQRAVEVAGLLIQALELALTKEGGPGKVDHRKDLEAVFQAFDRLKNVRD
jgi:hypothetical protein